MKFVDNSQWKIVYDEGQIGMVARTLLKKCATKALCFYGPMGAGKTALIKALVKELGGADSANSPSFGIVNEYHKLDGSLLAYHFDFYRLEHESEALDLGLEDYLGQDVWIFIEWPEKIKTFLPEDASNVQIEPINIGSRKLILE